MEGIIVFIICSALVMNAPKIFGHHSEGNPCKENFESWVCHEADYCDHAYQNMTNFCENDLVCCPEKKMVLNYRQEEENLTTKSEQMCKKYAETVFSSVCFDDHMDFKVDSCGFSFAPLVIGAAEANPREFPHMALIGYGDSPISWNCVGSLISNEWIISSAHCATLNPFGVPKWALLGDLDIYSEEDAEVSSPLKVPIIEIIVHSEFKFPEFYNDIGLYRLEEKVNFNQFIRPICLYKEINITDKIALSSGWRISKANESSPLEKHCLRLLSNSELCNQKYNRANFRRNNALLHGVNESTMLCAWPSQYDSCQSIPLGWPLMKRLSEPYCMYGLIGISSYGLSCGENLPDIYTRLSHYIPWIESTVWS